METLFLRTAFVFLALSAAGFADTANPSRGKSESFRFSIVPKSFQKNPQIDCNIITEVTPAGKKLKQPTAAKPVYYLLQPGLYQSLGEQVPANIKPPSVVELQRAMAEALSFRGYLESKPPKHPPTLVVIFSYGDHWMTTGREEDHASFMEAQRDYETAKFDRELKLATQQDFSPEPGPVEGAGRASSEDLPPLIEPIENSGERGSAEELLEIVLADRKRQRQLIDRAGLVGGVAFATELAKVLKEEVAVRASDRSNQNFALRRAARMEEENITALANRMKDTIRDPATVAGAPVTSFGPFRRFYQKNQKRMHLIEDTFSSCFFVIASAFDGAAIARGERRLLWRTKMTLNARGINMADSLPTLVNTAAPFFGKETDGTVTITKRIVRGGQVEIGTPSVVESGVQVGEPAADKKD